LWDELPRRRTVSAIGRVFSCNFAPVCHQQAEIRLIKKKESKCIDRLVKEDTALFIILIYVILTLEIFKNQEGIFDRDIWEEYPLPI